ncbi:BRO family protein [uncultured Propionivibrio sp.]|uniref:BRO-N domain-containing protein n=1 Tax=uncultured Propionivibrio sp. TaxID=426737 RepID=UPI0029C095E3|nr:BRO family protein [uncultured Propionivibrio sp.]
MMTLAIGLLGYASQHTKKLDKSEVEVIGCDSRISSMRDYLSLFDRQAPTATLISESGLYKLIMRSDKPGAKPFQDWVTKVVLPAIRKDGAYIMGEEKVATGELGEDELVLKAVSILQKKVERITMERDQLAQQRLDFSTLSFRCSPWYDQHPQECHL